MTPDYCFWKLTARIRDSAPVFEYGCQPGALYPGEPPKVCPECGREVCREVKE